MAPSGWDEGTDDSGVVRAKTEEGTELTRARNGRPRDVIIANYSNVSLADMQAVRTFVKTTINQGSGAFFYTNPVESSVVYTVKLTKNPRFKYAGWFNGPAYNFDLEMREQ